MPGPWAARAGEQRAGGMRRQVLARRQPGTSAPQPKPLGPISRPRDRQLQAGCPPAACGETGSVRPGRTVDGFWQLSRRVGTVPICRVWGLRNSSPLGCFCPVPGENREPVFFGALPPAPAGSLGFFGEASACLGSVASAGEPGRCERGLRAGTERSAASAHRKTNQQP